MPAPVATLLTAAITVNTTSNSTIASTSTVNAPANKTIVALHLNSNARTLTTFEDGANTYVEAVDHGTGGAAIAHVLDPATARASGSTFTATLSASGDRKTLGVFSLDAKTTSEGAASNAGSGTVPSVTSGSLPADCIVIAGAYIERQDGSFTLPANWVLIEEVPVSTNRDMVYAYYNTTGVGTVTFNPTYTGSSGAWKAALSAYKAVAAGSTYTLAADAGSYALTGTAASLELGRLVSAASGSYALTGTAASPELGRLVAANAGSYALTGSAASLLVGYKVAGGAGSYALTGSDATLTYVAAEPAAPATAQGGGGGSSSSRGSRAYSARRSTGDPGGPNPQLQALEAELLRAFAAEAGTESDGEVFAQEADALVESIAARVADLEGSAEQLELLNRRLDARREAKLAKQAAALALEIEAEEFLLLVG